MNLAQHYLKKWNDGEDELFSQLNTSPFTIIRNHDNNKHLFQILVFSSEGKNDTYYVCIEYDSSEKANDYCSKYGIYFGVKHKDGVPKLGKTIIEKLWNQYYPFAFPNEDVDKENVFLTYDIDGKGPNSQWDFWVRMEEKFALRDLSGHLLLLSKNLYMNPSLQNETH